MPNTYTQIYIHIVFAVKNREYRINEAIREDVQKYLTGIIQNRKHKLLAVYCMPNHTHILIGYNPEQSLSDLVRDVKASSSKYINEKKLSKEKFNWQEGYGAFSYSKSQIDRVIKYINNQPQHHSKKSFREEYLEILKKYEIEYDEKYLFNWLE